MATLKITCFQSFQGKKGVSRSAVGRIDIWGLLDQLRCQDPTHKFPSLRPRLFQLKNEDTQIYCEKCKTRNLCVLKEACLHGCLTENSTGPQRHVFIKIIYKLRFY